MKISDKIVAFSAIFISACALAVSIYQTRILSMEKDAAVWPYLQIETSWQPNRFILSVANDGVGPALVQDMIYEFKDTTFYRIQDIVPVIAQQDSLLRNNLNNFSFASIERRGTAIKAGESRNILDIEHESQAVIEQLQQYIYVDRIKIKIDYCSIYKKCWRNQDNEITKLD